MAGQPHQQVDQQVCLSLYSATNALIRAYRPLLEPLGLTYPQYLVMLTLWEADDVPISTICNRTRLDTGTITPLLKRLEQKRLIRRVPAPDDERSKRVHLTPAGRQLCAKASEIPFRIACAAGLNEEEGRLLKSLSERLYDHLGEKSA